METSVGSKIKPIQKIEQKDTEMLNLRSLLNQYKFFIVKIIHQKD